MLRRHSSSSQSLPRYLYRSTCLPNCPSVGAWLRICPQRVNDPRAKEPVHSRSERVKTARLEVPCNAAQGPYHSFLLILPPHPILHTLLATIYTRTSLSRSSSRYPTLAIGFHLRAGRVFEALSHAPYFSDPPFQRLPFLRHSRALLSSTADIVSAVCSISRFSSSVASCCL